MYYEVTVTRIDYSDIGVGIEADSAEEAKAKAIEYAIEDGSWQVCDSDFEAGEPEEITEDGYRKNYDV